LKLISLKDKNFDKITPKIAHGYSKEIYSSSQQCYRKWWVKQKPWNLEHSSISNHNGDKATSTKNFPLPKWYFLPHFTHILSRLFKRSLKYIYIAAWFQSHMLLTPRSLNLRLVSAFLLGVSFWNICLHIIKMIQYSFNLFN